MRGGSVALASVGPDRSGEKEIEPRAEDGRIKIRVEIEACLFELHLLGCKKISYSILHSLASRKHR
jgi:hypothetical protein